MSMQEASRSLNYNDIIKLKQSGEGFFVDVRDPDEVRATGPLPGSINIPLGDLKEALDMSGELFQKKYRQPKPGRDAKLVFSCRSGNRSAQALRMALSLGFRNAVHYAGGFLDWERHSRKSAI